MYKRMYDQRVALEHAIRDLVSDLTHHDRDEDEELPRGAIEAMLEQKVITQEWMVEVFRQALAEALS